MSVTAVITTGNVSLDYPDRRIRRRWDDLDEVTQTFQRATGGLFQPGTAFPGLSNMIIREVTETEEVPGSCFVYDLRAIGITGSGVRVLANDEQRNEDGFDEASMRWLAPAATNVGALGSVKPGTTSMYCVSRQKSLHPQSPTWAYITATYRGLLTPKPVKITWTSTGREISRDALKNLLDGGWNDFYKSEILWPRPAMTISYVSLSVPRGSVPQQSGSAPHIQAPFVFVPNISGPEEDFIWHWPNGWVLMSLDTDIIAGTTVARVTENWVYNVKKTW